MLINLRNALMAGKRLPYDAEVEYLRVDAVGPYIVIDGVTYCNAVGTYYAFTISSGGVVTHDLIPVRLGNTGYMYDHITNKRFGNAGTGDFVLGPDVVPVNFVDGEAYNSSGAIITAQGFSRIDDYLPVIGGHSVTFNYGGASNSNCAMIVYNSEKTKIDYWAAAFNNERTITMNANGAFARFAVYEESKQRAFLRDNTTGEYIMTNGKRVV